MYGGQSKVNISEIDRFPAAVTLMKDQGSNHLFKVNLIELDTVYLDSQRYRPVLPGIED